MGVARLNVRHEEGVANSQVLHQADRHLEDYKSRIPGPTAQGENVPIPLHTFQYMPIPIVLW